ncbi:hypothetical protein KJS94_16395 [Flavihumibacter rivuli]|uniref:hypothetical protein n=1 Tax=Flavihumibacter rivuli TaxID=2838156 RepID=UPI001BDEADA0|nr:hypothetical protein [Flavihumibacter rivuli]ULQ56231.1 hypothetical protein KJS94_16395 [Flavihumibacter rivuli]
MKHLLFSILLFFTANKVFSQGLPKYDEIKLENKEDFNDAANNAALQAANYLLSTPMDSKSIDRLTSLQYIIKWMSGSPDFSFTLDEQATKFAKNNEDLLGLYMAAMTKYVLENKTESKDQNKIKLNAVRLIIQYSKDTSNNVKINKEIKKAIEAEENGKLEEYLKI